MKYRYCLLMAPCAFVVALSVGTLNAQQPPKLPDDVEMLRNVEFGKGGNQKLTMHILRPRTVPKEPMPVLVYIKRQGAWGRDNKDLAIGRLIATAQQGYFGATIQVRTSGEAVFPRAAQRRQVRGSLSSGQGEGLPHRYHRIGILGRFLRRPPVCPGRTDHQCQAPGRQGWLARVLEPGACRLPDVPGRRFLVPDWPERHNTGPNGPAFRLLGGDPRKDKAELAKKASPLTYITKDSPPFFIVHGDKDTTVPYSQGELLLAALKKAGVEATLYTREGWQPWQRASAQPDCVKEFFDKQLKNSSKTNE